MVKAWIAGKPIAASAPGGKDLASGVNIASIAALSPVRCALVKRSFCRSMRADASRPDRDFLGDLGGRIKGQLLTDIDNRLRLVLGL